MLRKFLYTVVVFSILYGPLFGQKRNTDYQYALIEAVKQKNIGNLPGAVELYKMVIEANDSVAVAHYELGTLYAVTGNMEIALSHLKKANELDPDNSWYFDSYLDVLMNQKELRLSKKLLKEKLKTDPDNVDYLFRLANVYSIGGKSSKAINTLINIEKDRGISDRITLMKANIYEQDKKYDKALAEVKKLINLFPESIEFNVVAAELALKNKNKDEAAVYYQDVFELDSLNIYALTNLTDYYRNNKDYEKSFYYLNKSFQSDEIEYQKKMAILSYYLSDQDLFRNQNEQLETLIKTMLEKYPEKREIHLFATDFYIQNRKYSKALATVMPLLTKDEKRYELWMQAILLANTTANNDSLLKISSLASSLFPDSTEITYFKGFAEYSSEKYEDAVHTFSDEGLKDRMDSDMYTQARIILAESLNNLERYSISDSLFRAIIKEEPDNYMVMNNFAYYLSVRGEALKEAERLSFKTIEKFPDNGTFLDTYAWILFKMARYDEAEFYIMKALKYGGENDPDVNEHAGEINQALGNFLLARTFYQKAIVLGGDKEKLIKKLEEIQGK